MDMKITDKYAPKCIDDLILDENQKEFFKTMIETKKYKNIMLYGRPGVGKSTIAEIISKSATPWILNISGSVDNGVDMVRNTITPFCDTYTSEIKYVVINEADKLTRQTGTGSGAQDALRNVMDNAKDVYWIFTLNYIDKMEDAIISRFGNPISLSNNNRDIMKRVIQILEAENVEFDRETLNSFHSEVVKKKSPDVRSIIDTLGSWIMNGKLEVGKVSITEMDSIIDYIIKEKDPRTIRKHLIENEELFSREYGRLAVELFNRVDTVQEMEIIGHGLDMMKNAIDVEVAFSTMIIMLKKK